MYIGMVNSRLAMSISDSAPCGIVLELKEEEVS